MVNKRSSELKKLNASTTSSFLKFFGAKNFKKASLSFFGERIFHFLKYKNFFFRGNFLIFLSLCLKVAPRVFILLLGVECIPQEVLSKIKGKSITHKIFRIQSDDFIIERFHCIAFIEIIIAGKKFSDYTNLFSPNDYRKNDKMIYKYFKDKYGKRKHKSCIKVL